MVRVSIAWFNFKFGSGALHLSINERDLKMILRNSKASMVLPLIGWVFGFGLFSQTALGSPPKSEVIEPASVFLPQGFDDNDNVQVIIHGVLPKSCYRAGPVSRFVDRVNRQITLRATAYVYANPNCQPVSSTYTSVIDLGLLPRGDYQVKIETAAGEQLNRGVLPVEHSTTSRPDNFLYGWVQEARTATSEGRTTLTLTGRLGSGCYRLSEVKVFYREAARVVEVLPIAEQVEGVACDSGPVSFESQVVLAPQWNGTTLVHVRSLSGQSVNRVVNF